MPYEKSQMLYDDGKYYKWAAKADHDNPYYRKGTDYRQINKTEGYEVLYFINHIASKWWPNQLIYLESYRKMERLLRTFVPGNSTHQQAEDSIKSNWNN